MCENVLYCHQLLNHQSKKKIIKRRQLSKLTSEEKILFEEEELLSAYQNIIANACGQHHHRQQVLFDELILELFVFDVNRSKFCKIVHRLNKLFYLFIDFVVEEFILEHLFHVNK